MSPALSFSGIPVRGPFWEQILRGDKTVTTREVRADGRLHCAKGDILKLYWMQRAPPTVEKPIHLIGSAYAVSCTRHLSLYHYLITRGSSSLVADYIAREGFKGLSELLNWWLGEGYHCYGTFDGGLMFDGEAAAELRGTGPIEVIQWQYPLISAEKPRRVA